jgi:hypothetical protein
MLRTVRADSSADVRSPRLGIVRLVRAGLCAWALAACAELPESSLGGGDAGVAAPGTGGSGGVSAGSGGVSTGSGGRAGGSGGNGGGPEGRNDGGGTPPDTGASDGAAPAAVACPARKPEALADAWLAGYLDELLAKLTGEREYEPGKKLLNRATVENRRISRALLSKTFTDLGLMPQEHAYGTGTNVFAILPSTTGSQEHVVVGAHFDTVPGTPGANDNATGTAAVLAAARLAKQQDCRSRNVTFVLFDEEEVGLVGSKRFARKLSDEGTLVHSVHTVDQIGWDENQNRLIELERGDADLRVLYENAVKALGVDVPLVATGTGSTDHVSFRPRFRAIGVTEEYAGGDTTPHRHVSTDAYKTVNLEYLRSTSAVVNRVVVDLLR